MGYVYYNSYRALQRKTLTREAVEEQLQQAGSSDKLDLEFTNLVGLDLHTVDLSGANLSRSNLSKANLEKANLSKANLEKAELQQANLSHANLSKADLEKAELQQANLNHANLRRANLNHADLFDADLRGADLFDADLRGADLRDAHLSGADLSGADLSGANLLRADLSDADLRRADLRRAELGRFSGVRDGANLERADLRGADLREARLWGTRLKEADLSTARLDRSYLLLAFLNRARLRLARAGTPLAKVCIRLAKAGASVLPVRASRGADATSSPRTGIRRFVFYLIPLMVLASAASAGYFLRRNSLGALFAMLLAAFLIEDVWNVAESMVHSFPGVAKVLQRASMLVRRRIVQEESALASPLLFWVGIALFGLGWKLAAMVGTWNALYGLISITVGFGMVLPGWIHTLRHSYVSFLEYISHALMPLLYLIIALAVGVTPHASFLEYIFYVLVLLISIALTSVLGVAASIAGVELPLGVWMSMASSPMVIVAFLLWKVTDFLDELDEALKGPIGWLVLGYFFVDEGMGIGGIWTDVGIALAIVCALVGLAWKLIRIAVLEGSLAHPPTFPPPPPPPPEQWNLGHLRWRTRYPWLAFFAVVTGGYLLVVWQMDPGVVKQSADSFLVQSFGVVFLISIYLCIAAMNAGGWRWSIVIVSLNIAGYFIHFPVLGTLLFALVGNER